METLSQTVIWAVLGLILIALEAFTTSFFVLFFGLSALCVAFFRLFGLNHLNTEIFIFALGGVLGVIGLRKKLYLSLNQKTNEQTLDLNQTVTLIENILPQKTGRVEYQGTTWQAKNISNMILTKQDTARISKTSGTTLFIEPINTL